MQIKINLQIFFFIVLFILTHQIEMYTCIMLFAFIHELGHLVSGIILKLKPKALSIMPFGISITFETYGYKKMIEIKKIIIAMGGPITNILIGIISIFLNINTNLKEIIIYTNIIIAFFNLIPLYPLDGGRILKGIVILKKDKMKADKIVNVISNTTLVLITAMGSVAILYLKNIAILCVLIYLWTIVIKQNRIYNIEKKIKKIKNIEF